LGRDLHHRSFAVTAERRQLLWAETSAPSLFSTDKALVGAGLRENGRLSPQDARCAASILRDLGYQQDQHQTRSDGGKRARLWRRATVASDSPPPSETAETACSAVSQGDLSQISDEFIESSTNPLIGGSVGKTSESSEPVRAGSGIGSGADAFYDDDDPAWGDP